MNETLFSSFDVVFCFLCNKQKRLLLYFFFKILCDYPIFVSFSIKKT